MRNFNLLSKSSSQSCSHSIVTLCTTVGSPSAHRRGTMLKLLSVLVLILTFGIGQMWGAGVATLPFAEYDGGDAPTGLTRTGVGAYDTSPKCKFDGTNDVITIQFSDIPYQLKYTIKGNSFSGGTFTVSESADGTNWSTVAEYTTLGSAQNETKDLLTTTRYVRLQHCMIRTQV